MFILFIYLFIVFVATAPSGPRPSHSRGFYITSNDAPQSVGLLWMSDQLVAETSTWHHSERLQTDTLDRPATGPAMLNLFFCGAVAQSGPWPPHSWGYWITQKDSLQSVGLLWTCDQLVAEISTWQLTTITTDKHPCCRWNSKPRSQQADLRIRPRGYWDRQCWTLLLHL